VVVLILFRSIVLSIRLILVLDWVFTFNTEYNYDMINTGMVLRTLNTTTVSSMIHSYEGNVQMRSIGKW